MSGPESTDAPWSEVLDEVTGALETLTAVLDTEEDFRVLLRQVCLQVVQAVPGVDEATVTLVDGEAWTAATTSEVVAELDRDQYRNGGPCLEAANTGGLIRASMPESLQRWPMFARDAHTAGFDSFLSAPLVVNTEHAGAINCYGTRSSGFRDLEAQLLELYTTAAEAILRTYQRYLKAAQLTKDLRTALATRAVIDQAKGILMAIRQISADEAFAVLIAQSQQENVKLREVAERFVTHATGTAPQATQPE